MNKTKICLNKKLLFVLLSIVILCFTVISLSIVLQRKQQTVNSKAAPPKSNLAVYLGLEAKKEQWPFVARIMHLTPEMIAKGTVNYEDDGYCDAVLITNQWLLTAGHCIVKGGQEGDTMSEKIESKNLAVFLGSSSLFNADEGEYRTLWETWWRTGKAVFLHPNFTQDEKTGEVQNDIALLKMTEPISKDHIKPVLINTKINLTEEGTPSVLIGWGRIVPYVKTDKLFYVVQPSLNREIVKSWASDCSSDRRSESAPDCNTKYQDRLNETHLVFGYPNGGSSQCNGDSGGPYMVWDEDLNRWALAGVVSWSDKSGSPVCGAPKKPGVAINVSKYMDWISQTINDNKDNRDISFPIDENSSFTGNQLTNTELEEYYTRICNGQELGKQVKDKYCRNN